MGKETGKRPPHNKFLPYSVEKLWGWVKGEICQLIKCRVWIIHWEWPQTWTRHGLVFWDHCTGRVQDHVQFCKDLHTSLSPRFKRLLPPVKQRKTCVSIHMLKDLVLQRELCSAKVAYTGRNTKTIESITTVYPLGEKIRCKHPNTFAL